MVTIFIFDGVTLQTSHKLNEEHFTLQLHYKHSGSNKYGNRFLANLSVYKSQLARIFFLSVIPF